MRHTRGGLGSGLAPGLVRVHPAVCRCEQGLVAVPILREHGGSGADTEREVLAGPRLEVQLLDCPLELDPFPLSLVGAAVAPASLERDGRRQAEGVLNAP